MTPIEKLKAVVDGFILTHLMPIVVIFALGFVIYIGVTQYLKLR